MSIKSLAGAVLAGALLFSGLTTAVEARTLRYAIGHPPSSFVVDVTKQYAEQVETLSDGDLKVRVFPMSLLNFAETSGGVRDGMADIGFVLTSYFPSEYPHSNVAVEASMLVGLLGEKARGREGMIFMGALSEFTFFHCPECNQEFKKQNQVYTGSTGGTSYGLVCNEPVKSEADLNGMRLRVGASNWSRWAESVGASPVTMSANEMFEALSQGVVSCIVLASPEIHNFGLTDVVTDINMDVPGGPMPIAGTNINADTWKSLSPEQREVMLRAASVFSAGVPWIYHQHEDRILAEAEERGVGIHHAEPALIEKTRAFIEDDMQHIAEDYRSRYGVENGDKLIADFRKLLEKWTGLVQDVETEQDLADLYWDEIFSKVDVEKHGL
ncbi:TRAP transporter substrate-binding protein [Alcanivorax sp. 521-1]|uniref:TRAP transporter substrate-binding protein n=1 Tax=Alloalcanivorax profundimaris TaxID=2735259 RepID=A0ABS0AP19_9GAMM|nr:C4-dicarboxylate TRAP transporter substrate-binding protein [Alloalcanivorax profundimaris]MBF5055755.1 TRAP transporter substrate-binding protein [Alloalcanivorax profundimaris]